VTDAPSLILIQFLSWVADRPRRYTQTMEAWRTSCPRLSVWEDAVIDNLVRIGSGGTRTVTLTERGHGVLRNAQSGQAGAAASLGKNSEPKRVRSGPRRRAGAGLQTY
jgi:hypothetical protein